MNKAVALVGLKCHPQFVSEVIDEGSIVQKEDGKIELRSKSPKWRVGQNVSISIEDISKGIFPYGEFTKFNESLLDSPALDWLTQSWKLHSDEDKFIALFVAMEIIAKKFKPTYKPEPEQFGQIREILISQENAQMIDLSKHFEELVRMLPPPSLADHFDAMARVSKLENWENDIGEFRRFRKIRNAVIHQGKFDIKNGDVHKLQQMVMRYMEWALIQDERKI